MRFELAETPRPRPRQQRAPGVKERQGSPGTLRRVVVATVVVLAAGVAGRWALAQLDPAALSWLSNLFDGS